MDEPLEEIIRLILEDAPETGQDYLTQPQLAVRTAQKARTDIMAPVNWIRRS